MYVLISVKIQKDPFSQETIIATEFLKVVSQDKDQGSVQILPIIWIQTNEPRHDKTNKVTVRPAKPQISLGIRPVWLVASLSAWRKLESLATHWAHSEDPDQTERMPRLIWVFAGRTCHFVGFVMRWLRYQLLKQRNVNIRNSKSQFFSRLPFSCTAPIPWSFASQNRRKKSFVVSWFQI